MKSIKCGFCGVDVENQGKNEYEVVPTCNRCEKTAIFLIERALLKKQMNEEYSKKK